MRWRIIPRRKIHVMEGEICKLIQSVFNKDRFTNWVSNFEEEFARFIGAKYAMVVSSGRQGMEFIFRSLGLNKGDEIIIPAYTLKDLVSIIQSMGLIPVAADVHPKTFNIDPHSVVERITERTRAILATHLFGTPCQIDQILEIAQSKSIFVIEDCAHSVGSEFKGCQTGLFGNASFFSLETIKPINTYGGGMVTTNDGKLAHNLRKTAIRYEDKSRAPLKKIIAAFLESWFLPTPLSFPTLYLLASQHWRERMYSFYRRAQTLSAAKSPFTDFQGFIGLEKLKTLKQRISRRQAQANLLRSLLSKEVIPQQIGDGVCPNYYFFVALLPSDIWKARKFLLMRGIDAGIGEEIADDCGRFLEREDCPNATEVSQHAIQLPLHEGMLESHIQYVARVLGELFK